MTLDRRKNKRAGRAAKLGSQTSRMDMSETSTSNNEHIEPATESGKEVADEATRASANIALREAETAQQSSDAGLNSAVHSFRRVTDQFQRATDQFTQVFGVAGPQAEEMARRASRNIEAVSQASTVLTKGAQELSREWFDLIRDQFAKHLDAMNRVAGCRSLQDLVSVQSEIVRDRLGEAVNSSRRIAEVSFRITDEAARIIQCQANQNVAGIRAAS
jgi:phasin family protein